MKHSNKQRASSARAGILRRHPLALACAAVLISATAMAADVPSDTTSPSSGADAQTTPAQTSPADQQTPPEKKKTKALGSADETLDTITVTGIKASIQGALQAKENSDSIIEAISAEDLGKLPDLSIAESLARLPGLATQQVDGHANLISIRGTTPDFVGTTLNGREQATNGENRGVEFDQYPAELMSGAAVYKTPDASVIGQGLAGTIDLHTVKPLDFKDATMAVNVRGEHNSNGDLNPGQGVGTSGHRLSFSYIDQFLDHTLGIAVGVAQLDSPIQEKQYQAWWWGVNNGPPGSGAFEQCCGAPHVPGEPDLALSQEGMQARAKSEDQLRNSFMSVIEWAPSEVYHSELDLFYSKAKQESYTNGLQWSNSPWDGIGYQDAITKNIGGNEYVVGGTLTGIHPIMENDYNNERDYLLSVGWNNRFDFGDQWQASTDLSYSRASNKIRDAYLFTGLAGAPTIDVPFSIPIQNGYPTFSVPVDLTNPGSVVFTDPTNYGYDGREEFDHQKDEIKAFRVEVSHPLGWIFSSVNLGFDYSDREKSKSALVYFAYLNGNGSKLAGNYINAFYSPINSSSIYSPTSLGYAGVPGILDYGVLGALANQFYVVQDMGTNDYNRNYTVEEKVPLVYAKFNIDTQLAGIPIRGNTGVQIVHTEQSSTSLQIDPNSQLPVGNLSGGTSYNKVLPSLNLVGDLGDRTYVRFGLAKSMARPRIDDERIAATASVNAGSGPAVWSGSGGNPYLKPYVAVGTDLAFEKYFGDASYVSAAIFNKNLLSYIYTLTDPHYDFSGYVNPTNITPISNYGAFSRPANGTGGKVQGVDLGAALEGKLLSSYLDGFGLQGNFSYNKTSIPESSISNIPGSPTTLPGFSKKTSNVTLYYEKYGFSFRLSQNYRSAYQGEITANFGQLAYTQIMAHQQTDFQAGYEFKEGRLKGMSLLLQAYNLNNAPYRTQQNSPFPNGASAPLEYDTYGRTLLFGLNYKL